MAKTKSRSHPKEVAPDRGRWPSCSSLPVSFSKQHVIKTNHGVTNSPAHPGLWQPRGSTLQRAYCSYGLWREGTVRYIKQPRAGRRLLSAQQESQWVQPSLLRLHIFPSNIGVAKLLLYKTASTPLCLCVNVSYVFVFPMCSCFLCVNVSYVFPCVSYVSYASMYLMFPMFPMCPCFQCFLCFLCVHASYEFMFPIFPMCSCLLCVHVSYEFMFPMFPVFMFPMFPTSSCFLCVHVSYVFMFHMSPTRSCLLRVHASHHYVNSGYLSPCAQNSMNRMTAVIL